MAASDYFLKIDGIKGESTADGHKDEIDIQSFSWGVSQAGSFADVGGGGSGKAAFQDMHFVTSVSKASVPLLVRCATGEHITSALLVCRKAGGKQEEFLKITLTDCLVSSYTSGGAGGSDIIPTDQFSLNYAKIEVGYAPQKAGGGLDAVIRGGYDLKIQKKS